MLRRGSTLGADCAACPFAVNGEPVRPVLSEHPAQPAWIIVGEGPSRTDVQLQRPFCGAQQLVEKMLAKVGRQRDEVYLTTAHLCAAPVEATPEQTAQAVRACQPRLRAELRTLPGVPVLTLGAAAAQAVLPQATLAAIDPPDVPKSHKRSQKDRQRAEAKALRDALKAQAKAAKAAQKLAAKEAALATRAAKQRDAEIADLAKQGLARLLDHQRDVLRAQIMRAPLPPGRKRKPPSRRFLDAEIAQHYRAKLKAKADADARIAWELAQRADDLRDTYVEAHPVEARPEAKRKPKQVAFRLTDIVSTCFEVDADGSGVPRPVIPSIHPGVLLAGGGASVNGTHTPDLAFINLYYDAMKVDALARGVDVRLKLNVLTEVEDADRAARLLQEVLDEALREGEVALDLETYVEDEERHSALQAYAAQIKTIGLATTTRAVSVMWALLPPWALSYLQLVLAHPQVTKTFHNGLYDRTVLMGNGFALAGPWEDCYVDSETEFLTAEGWRKYDQIGSETLLGTITRDGRLEWQPFYHRTERKYAGRALVFETLHTRAVVTPNHRMWARPLRRTAKVWRGVPMGPWGFTRAEDLLRAATDTFEIQQTCAPPEPSVSQHDAAVIELLGIWLADGSIRYHADEPVAIVVSQEKNGRASSALRRLATVLPLTVREQTRDDAWRTHALIEEHWRLNDRVLAARFVALGRYSRERRLPLEVFTWSREERALLLESLFLGDGSPQTGRGNRFIYRSGSLKLADDVQALALSLGWTATNPPSYRPDGIAHVFVNREAAPTIAARMRTSGANARVTETVVNDRIVCFSVPNETLITRSNGKPAFYGNTLLAHHATFPGCAHRLQAVTSQFFAVAPWKAEYRNNAESAEGLTAYNAQDTGATLALRAPLTVWLQRTKTEQIYALDLKMAEIASAMHLVGMPVDRARNQHLLQLFTANVKQARQAIERVVEDPAIREDLFHHLARQQASTQRKHDPADPEARYQARLADLANDASWRWKINGSKDVAALLLALGVPLIQRTEAGLLSTKKDVLEGLVHVPVVRDLLQFRANDKLLSTFVWMIFDRYRSTGERIHWGFADDEDRIHPIWSIHKITGRWASSSPVVSNVPKDKWRRVLDVPAGLMWQPAGEGKWTAVDAHGVPWQKDDKGRTMQQIRPNLRAQIVAPPGRVFVGFDFCLAKGTLIDTPSGHRPIEDLRRGDLVFSYDQTTHRPRARKIAGQVSTGYRETLVVVLDNGERVRCTPDHRWLVRVRGHEIREVQAQDLVPGERLLPLRRNRAGVPGADYETLYSYSAFEYAKAHVVVAEAAHGPRPHGAHVHHLDGDRFNNRPENLAYVDEAMHLSDHAAAATTAQWQDPATRAKMQAGIKSSIAARGGYMGANNPRFGQRSGVATTCPQCGAATYLGGKHPKRFCSRACYHAFRKANPVPKGTKYGDLNHKVVEVIRDGLVVETFDIEVEDDHNFALAAGVFVHNCQLEARVIALISGDPFLCQVFADGKDIHRECARAIFPTFDSMSKEEQKKAREETKPLEYGAFYGGSVETLWKQLLKEGRDVKLADVAKSVGALMARMAGVVQWQQATIARAGHPPYEITEFLYGRRRTFPLGQVEPTEALNFGVQAAGASIMNTGMARMWDQLRTYKQAYAITQIHDAAVFECWEDDAERLQADVIRCFTQSYDRDGRTIPFPVEAKIGRSWAEV